MSQNTPNPFMHETTIKYYLSTDVHKARIDIYKMNGVLLRSFSLSQKGGSSLRLNSNSLESGEYIYSLFIDNIHVDSKK